VDLGKPIPECVNSGFYWSCWWQLELWDVQSSSQIVTTNETTPSFVYRSDVIPITHPTESRHCRESINIPEIKS